MKIRGLIIGVLGLALLLFPEGLDAVLKHQQDDEKAMRKKERMIGGVLVFIGLFVAAVDNL